MLLIFGENGLLTVEGWARPRRPVERVRGSGSFPSALRRHDLTTVTGDSAKVWPQDSDRSEFGATTQARMIAILWLGRILVQ